MSLHMITGGAGFVAVTLAARLLDLGHRVLAIDDLSRGREDYLRRFLDRPDQFHFQRIDCNDLGAVLAAAREFGGVEHVWHLAANSDIPAGVADPRVDLTQTFMTTFNILLAMRELGATALHFASSSAIYGDHGSTEIKEDIGPLAPISNYGAMKLASEVQIRAAVESWLPKADIFRFPNVVGLPATHGVILDLIRKLKGDPATLHVLGDGTQQKLYLHVDELVDAMLFIARAAGPGYRVLNIGPEDDGVTVRFIAEAVRDQVSPGAAIVYGSGSRGWVGDVPKFRYSVARLRTLGWSPALGSAAAVRRAVAEIAGQEV